MSLLQRYFLFYESHCLPHYKNIFVVTIISGY